jgi:hypothetical protein
MESLHLTLNASNVQWVLFLSCAFTVLKRSRIWMVNVGEFLLSFLIMHVQCTVQYWVMSFPLYLQNCIRLAFGAQRDVSTVLEKWNKFLVRQRSHKSGGKTRVNTMNNRRLELCGRFSRFCSIFWYSGPHPPPPYTVRKKLNIHPLGNFWWKNYFEWENPWNLLNFCFLKYRYRKQAKKIIEVTVGLSIGTLSVRHLIKVFSEPSLVIHPKTQNLMCISKI